jgi:NTP pyrophosphatase (non-canonical NTP hydrolase)
MTKTKLEVKQHGTVADQYTKQKLEAEMQKICLHIGTQPEDYTPEQEYTPDFSNQLTASQLERLAILSEELGEAVQVIGKILRHGYASVNPDKPEEGDNRNRLTVELGDVLAAIKMLKDAGDISAEALDQAKRNKMVKVMRYTHHQH